MTTVTDLTKASEARALLLDYVFGGSIRPSDTWQAQVTSRLDAYAAAVRSDTLADVAARLPEAICSSQHVHRTSDPRPCGKAFVAADIITHALGGTDR